MLGVLCFSASLSSPSSLSFPVATNAIPLATGPSAASMGEGGLGGSPAGETRCPGLVGKAIDTADRCAVKLCVGIGIGGNGGGGMLFAA